MHLAQRFLVLASPGFAVMIYVVACSSRPATPPELVEETGEDPSEERTESYAQEQAEESTETTTSSGGGGGQINSASTGGSSMSAMGGAAVSGSSGGVQTTGASGSSGASAGGSNAGGAQSTGMGGLGGSGGLASGGSGGAGGSSGASGSSGAGGAMTSYPMLNASDLGSPTRIPSTTPFTLAEGPLWDPCEHRLLFVDVVASKIYSLANGQISVFLSNTNNTNGIAFAPDGSLIMAQMKPGHVAKRDKSGNITMLDPPGALLHTPDDVIVRSDGIVYFTDGDFPPVGNVDLAPLPVYAILPGASQLSNGGTVAGPNGIELSPDEKTLYVDAYFQGAVVKFSVNSNGTITKGASLTTGLTNPDSLCIDAAGNLYVGVSTGLQVLRPDGTRVALIPIQSTQGVTNCTFGGDDGKTLYITAWTSIWQVPNMPIPGLEWMENRQRLGCM
jgi:gluconolactonase